MNKTNKKILYYYVLGPVLMVLFLWLIYLQIQKHGDLGEEWDSFLQTIRNREFVLWAIPAIALAPLNWLTEAVKWKFLLRKIERISLPKSFASVLSGLSLGLVTPNKIGDFFGRILFINPKRRLRAVMAAVVGIAAQWIVSFLFGTAGLFYLHFKYQTNWTFLTLILSVMGLAVFVYLFLNINKIAGRVAKWRSARVFIVAIYVLKRYSRTELIFVLGISLIRFCVYNLQFIILLKAFGAAVPFTEAFLLSGLMFWMITVLPTFFIADIGVRGFVTGMVFITPGVVENAFSVLAASYFLWLINWISPSLPGTIFALRKGIYKSISEQKRN